MNRSFLAVVVLVLATSCERMAATRNFNQGVRHYKAGEFELAVSAFEDANQRLSNAATQHNLALAHLSHVRKLFDDEQGASQRSSAIERAVVGIRDTRENPDLRDDAKAQLNYIEGSVLLLAQRSEDARAAFGHSRMS